MRTWIPMTLVVLLGAGAGGCCKTLSCATLKAARAELSCEQDIDISDVTDRVRAEARAGKGYDYTDWYFCKTAA